MNTGRKYTIKDTITDVKTNLIPKIQKRTFHVKVKAIKRIGPHDQDIFSVIFGSLLGKCTSEILIEGTRLCYRQSIIHKDYLFCLYNFFYTRGYCSNLEPIMYTRILKNGNKVVKHYGYEFNTFTFRSFNWIHKIFYKKGYKVYKYRDRKLYNPISISYKNNGRRRLSQT